MKIMRDFLCDECGESIERFIDANIYSVGCACGGKATRLIGTPRVALDGTDPGFPGAYDRWARIREDNARIKKKKSYAEQ